MVIIDSLVDATPLIVFQVIFPEVVSLLQNAFIAPEDVQLIDTVIHENVSHPWLFRIKSNETIHSVRFAR